MTEAPAGPRALPWYDRLAIIASLAVLTVLAWVYLWADAARMDAMPMGSVAMRDPLAPGVLALTFLMWAVMMVGMMLPSALPAIIFYSGLSRKHRAQGSAAPSGWVFTCGYLAVWTAFSLAAALLQAGLEQVRLLSPMMVSVSPVLTGGLLIAAGVYQWTPLKDVCLHKCRAPLQFFMFHWRPGTAGAFRMGAQHGLFCVGCCWALMLLLFAVGVMNLVWVAVIAVIVLIEKLMRWGDRFGKLLGAGLIAGGIAHIAGWV